VGVWGVSSRVDFLDGDCRAVRRVADKPVKCRRLADWFLRRLASCSQTQDHFVSNVRVIKICIYVREKLSRKLALPLTGKAVQEFVQLIL
jgi:hypothetical protein